MKFPDKTIKEKIGFNYIMERLEIKTPYGRDEVKHIKPFKIEEADKLNRTLDELTSVFDVMSVNEKAFAGIFKVLGKFRDIRAIISRMNGEFVLDDIEFFELKNFAMTLSELIASYLAIGISLPSIEFVPMNKIIELLNPYEKVVPSFFVHDKYSEGLRDIRKTKKELESLIIAEKDVNLAEQLRKKRLEIVNSERIEELAVRETLTKEVVSHKSELQENIKSIGRLELTLAKAKIALMYPSSRPLVYIGHEDNEKAEVLHIEGAINPAVMDSLRVRRQEFTPVSIDIKKGVTILTGANMGGKTVALSTVVLNAMLAALGFYVFAKEFTMARLSFISFVSGDLSDVSKGLSSFGAEVVRLADICALTSEGCGLVVFDEFARSTNPYEGTKFVNALCEYLAQCAQYSLVSTHYDGIVLEDAQYYQVVGLRDAELTRIIDELAANKGRAVEMLQFLMDYNIEKVPGNTAVPKEALKIAEILGLGDEFLRILKDKYR